MTSDSPNYEEAPDYGDAPHQAVERTIDDEMSEPPQMSAFARMGNIYVAPGEVFTDIRRSPAGWWMPLVCMAIVAIGTGFLLQTRLGLTPEKVADTAIEQGLQQQGKTLKDLSEQEKGAVEMQRSFMAFFFQWGWLLTFVTVPIGALIMAGLFRLEMLIFGAQTTFQRVFSAVSFAWAATTIANYALQCVLSFVVTDIDAAAFLRNKGLLATSPAAFVSMTEHPVLAAFLAFFDVFTLWFCALLVIGIAAVSKKRRTGTAFVIVAIPVGLLMLGSIGLAFLGTLR
jgi:hypothetical protein